MSLLNPGHGEGWSWESIWPAPAKLNLFLHVVGRRPDGYHLLQTLFRFVDWGDVLQFSPRQDGRVVLTNPIPGVPQDTDLTVRAARLLQQKTGCTQGVDIFMQKRLPMGGGLGGGSSDAATVLLALNHLWGLGLGGDQLQALGLVLGADVPVFVGGQNAFAEGVGEVLTPVALPEAWYVIFVPPVSVATASIFQSPSLCRDTQILELQNWRPGQGYNDLEPVVCAMYPQVAECLAWLKDRGGGRVTGSGACVFAELPDRETAEALFSLRPEGWQGKVCQGLSRHPLAGVQSTT